MSREEFEKYVQGKIDKVAAMLIAERPDIAKNNPKQIGIMAKMMTFAAMNQAINNF